MRCAACNKKMSEFEMVMKAPESGEFADLCGVCYNIAFDLEDKVESIEEIIGEITNEQDW
jgi:hypothetical protein